MFLIATGRSITANRRRRRCRPFALVLLAAVVVASSSPPARLSASQPTAENEGVTTLTGAVRVTNPFLFDLITEPFVILNDLSNFVGRDIDGPLPEFLQVIGQLDGDLSDATYTIALPIRPQATTLDVDNAVEGNGVQIYAVDLAANLVGDPFIDPIEGGGWASSFTSVTTAIGTNEIVGGRLIIWSPDDAQAFPSGFGDDGLLFTEDDPISPVEPGWTVVELSSVGFAFIRDAEVAIDIFEGDGGLNDLSDLSYIDAFDALVAELEVRYPFTAYKQIDWDDVVLQIRPRIVRAQETDDARLFQVAMMRFVVLLRDGHISVSPNIDYLVEQVGGGYGLSLGQSDDDTVVVTDVLPESSAAEAGIEPGTAVAEWNGIPIEDAIADVDLVFAASSPHTTTLQQLSLLTRGEDGDTAVVVFQTPDGNERAVNLEAEQDLDGLVSTFTPSALDLSQMPVTVEVLPSGYGYIRVNTFLDDMVLMVHAWDWAITTLDELDVPGLIVDVRGNGGGNGQIASLFAGTFYEDAFDLSEAYFADRDGEFVYNGMDVIEPHSLSWDNPVAVLIDENCASACELFSAAMAVDPDHLIVGQYPTAGVMAGIYPWQLPDDLYFQAPLLYFEANEQVWLEGVGVQPSLEVPVTVESLLSGDDVVLLAAEEALGER